MVHSLDKTGRPIKAGDYILYAIAIGKSPTLRFGKVLNVVSTPNPKQWDPNRIDSKITVMGVDGEYFHTKPSLLSKKSTLQFPERIVILDPITVPLEIMNLLSNF